MAIFAIVFVVLQVAGGAYQAEFDGHADEAAHFVSSLLVRDYLAQWPWPAPMPWAVDYYIHYPKVAIGHWPPGYYLIQGIWWLLFPPGRTSAMVLNAAMGLLTLGLFYSLARRIRDSWTAVAAGVVLLLVPVVQEASMQVMTEMPSLLCAVWLLWCLTRMQESPSSGKVAWVMAAIAGAMAVKGTGVALVAAPVIVVVCSGVWRRMRLVGLLGLPVAAGAAVAGLYLWQYRGSLEQIRNWGGISSNTIPWYVIYLPGMVGIGVLVLAAGGAVLALWRRQPAAVAALSLAVSVILTGYFVRAMREPRHWIAVMPALVLLALIAYTWLEERTRWAPLAVVAALILFPHKLYRQQPAGYAALAAQIHQPARMLVSSPLGWSEGPWIAVASLRERRPSSTIIRATKLLATTDWNSRSYQLQTAGPAEVDRKLDEMAVDLVVMHNTAAPQPLAHHALLLSLLRAHSGWKRCAEAGELEAYCRTQPPRYPRQPLRMDFRDRLGYDIEERP